MIEQWERFVRDHEEYQTSYSAFSKWLKEQSLRLASCSKQQVDKQEMEEAQSQLADMLADKQQEAPRLQHTVELGENLYPNTTAEGRDIIRQELRSLQVRWVIVHVLTCNLLQSD